MTAINNDAADTYETEQETADAFLSKWDVEKPSEGDEESEHPEAEEAEGEEDNSEAEEATEETEDGESSSEETEEADAEPNTKDKKYADDEGTFVKVKVGDEEHEVPVKDLKRLFGQEASLTKKSQEVAERTKAAELAQAKSLAALDVLVKRAQDNAAPYRNVNWAALMKDPTISAEDVGALQEAAKAAFDNEAFLTTQLDSYMQEINTQQAATQQQAAKACIQALTDDKSPTYIKGWDQKVYDDTRAFAVSMGVNQNVVNNLVDPAAFKLIHMAMQFHKGAQKTVTQKVNKAPKKIVKSSTTAPTASKTTGKVIERNKAVAAMKKDGGSMKSAENAFLALIGGDDK